MKEPYPCPFYYLTLLHAYEAQSLPLYNSGILTTAKIKIYAGSTITKVS
jgi:hypothetical protein